MSTTLGPGITHNDHGKGQWIKPRERRRETSFEIGFCGTSSRADFCFVLAMIRALAWLHRRRCHNSPCLASVRCRPVRRLILTAQSVRSAAVPRRWVAHRRLVIHRIAVGMLHSVVVGSTSRLLLLVVLTTSFSLGFRRRRQLLIRFALLHCAL